MEQNSTVTEGGSELKNITEGSANITQTIETATTTTNPLNKDDDNDNDTPKNDVSTDMYVPILVEVSTSCLLIIEITSWLGGEPEIFKFSAIGRCPLICDIGPLKGGNRYRGSVSGESVRSDSNTGGLLLLLLLLLLLISL